MADLNKMLEEVKGMSVLELNEFVKMLETEFGVSAAAMAVAAPAAGGAAAAPAAEEQTEFTVVLKEVGANKIAVIKVAREATVWAWPKPRRSSTMRRPTSRKACPKRPRPNCSISLRKLALRPK